MKPRNFYRICIGFLLLTSGVVTTALTTGETIIGIILLVAGITFLITGIVRDRRDGNDPESDERLRKIGAYGLSSAWLTGLFFMFALFRPDYRNILRPWTKLALALLIPVLAVWRRDLPDVPVPQRRCCIKFRNP